jgi:translocation and assembly module TamB
MEGFATPPERKEAGSGQGGDLKEMERRVESVDAVAAGKRTVSRRMLISGLGLFAGVVVGLVVFAAATRLAMASLREGLLQSFRDATGYDISYKTISPSFFQMVEIRGLRVTSRDAEKRTVLDVDKLGLSYDLLALVFESDKLRAMTKIEIENGRFAVDATKDRPLLESLETFFHNSGNEHRLSPAFSLSGRDLNIVYAAGAEAWALRHLFATVRTEGPFLRFSLHTLGEGGAAVTVRGPDYTTALDMAGRVKKDLSLLDADFRVDSLRAGEVILKEQQFHIGLKDKTLDITKVQDRSPLDLSLQYSFDKESLSVNFLAEDLQPGSLFAFTDKLAELRPILASRVTADGSLRYAVPRNDLDFSLALDGVLSDAVSPVPVRLHSRITGTEERIEFAPVSVSSPLGEVEFAGNVVYKTTFPEGRLRFVNVKTSVGDDVNADLSVTRSDRSVTLTGEKVQIGSAGFRTFILDVFPRPGELKFAVDSALDLAGRNNSIKLDGSLAYERGYRLALEGDLVSVPLNFIYRAVTKSDRFSASLDRSLETVSWTTHCSFATDFRTYSFRAPDITVRDERNAGNRLAFDVAASENELTVSPLRGTWAGYALGGEVSFQWRKQAGFSFAGGLSVDNEKYSIEGKFAPGTGLLVNGSYGFSLMLVPQPGGGQYVALQVARLPVPVQGQTLYATLDWIGTLSPTGDFSLVSRRTHVSGIPRLIPGMENAAADVRFSLHNGRLQVSELVYRDTMTTLEGNGSLDLEFSPEPRASGWLYLADENRVETYTAVLNLSGTQGDVNLFFENSPLAHWGDLLVKGSASGVLKMHGPLSDPVVDVALSLNNGRLNFEPLTLRTDLTLSSAGIQVRSLSGSYGRNLSVLSASGGFDALKGTLALDAVVSAGNQPVHAAIDFRAEIGDYRRGAPLPSLFAGDFKGSLTVVNADAKKGELGQWAVRFSSDRDGFNISGGPGEVLTGLMRRDGSFRFDLFPPFPLRGHFEGRINDNQIEARATGLVILLPALNELINTPFFVIQNGSVRGDLTVSGPAGDPDVFGILTVENLSATSQALADPIGPLSSVLEIKEKTMALKESVTKVGGCPLSVIAEMVLDHWNIARLTTRLAITDPAGAHLKLPVDILSFDGFVTTPGLILTVDYAGVSIDGPLFVQKCNVVLGKAKEEPKQEDANSNLVVNLSLKTGKQVEFYWPAKEFPILRMIAEPGAELALKYNQLKEEFSLNGNLNFKAGEVFYFERNFLIREGSLSLNETQLDFNPILNLKAERKVRYDDKDVKITMSVPNQHLKDFSPVFDTDPPLPITERYLALGGVIQNPNAKRSYESSDLSTANTVSLSASRVVSDVGGDVLTQLVLLHPLEQKMKELLNLDGFTIRTQFISNLILDTVFNNESGVSPDTAVNMGRYLNNTEISFQKYLDAKNNLFFETIVRIQADLAQGSGAGLSQTFGNVNVESEFSLELTTPFFLTIKWSITPEHWETFFLPDNKITFKWGMSF